MSLFQLILSGALCVLIFPALLAIITFAVCHMLIKTSEGVAMIFAIIMALATAITGVVFIAQAIARVAS